MGRGVAPGAPRWLHDAGMSSEQQHGVVFPRSVGRQEEYVGPRPRGAGRRAADGRPRRGAGPPSRRPTGARTTSVHFRRAVEAGLDSRTSALSIATDGLASLHDRMRVAGTDGEDRPGRVDRRRHGAGRPPRCAATGEPETELSLPYRGTPAARRRAAAGSSTSWVGDGVVEPTAAEAIGAVMANPDWLRAEGFTVAVLGAGAEMGPLPALLRWGARRGGGGPAAAGDLGAGPATTAPTAPARCVLPVPPRQRPDAGSHDRGGRPALRRRRRWADWLAGLAGTLVLGNYVYADGATNVRVAMAVDAMSAPAGRRPRRRGARVPRHADRRVRRTRGRGAAVRLRAYDERAAAAPRRWAGRCGRSAAGG